MAQLTTTEHIKRLGTILSVWAHPDDESFCCGGILAAAVANGQQVICATATRGEKGVQDEDRWPAERLGVVREGELAAALKVLGIKTHHWLGYNDGACDSVTASEAVQKIQELIEQYRPDTILTFGPDGLTGHPDHCTVSAWVSAATSGQDIAVYHVVEVPESYEAMKAADDRFNIFFNIAEPPLVTEADCVILLRLTGDLLEKKYQSLRVQPSQTEAMLTALTRDQVNRMFCLEAMVKAP